MATNNTYAVRFDFTAQSVTPYGVAELPKKTDEYLAYRQLEQWVTEKVVHKPAAVQLLNIMFGFRARVHGAYTSYVGNGGLKNLPTHDEYVSVVEALNKAIADGDVTVTAQAPAAPATGAPLTSFDDVTSAIHALTAQVNELAHNVPAPRSRGGWSRFLTGNR